MATFSSDTKDTLWKHRIPEGEVDDTARLAALYVLVGDLRDFAINAAKKIDALEGEVKRLKR